MLDEQSGALSWRWQTSMPAGMAINAPSLVGGNGVLHLATPNGLFALRASDGHLLWHGAAEGNLSFVAPTVAA
jgi:outer membrane protein assembly factor BamB